MVSDVVVDPLFGGEDAPIAAVWLAFPGERHWHPGQVVSRVGHRHDDFEYHGHDRDSVSGCPGIATFPDEWGCG